MGGLALVLVLTLAGCGTGSGLFADASPETSALSLYSYDGETVTRRILYDTEQEKAVLKALNQVSADLVSWILLIPFIRWKSGDLGRM